MGWGGPRNFDPDDIRQMRREVRERIDEVQDLAALIERLGADPRDLQTMLDAMRALDRNATYDDPEEVLRLQSQLVEGMKQFEFQLRRDFAIDEENEILLYRAGEVPDEYKALVAEYFRALSRGTGNDGR